MGLVIGDAAGVGKAEDKAGGWVRRRRWRIGCPPSSIWRREGSAAPEPGSGRRRAGLVCSSEHAHLQGARLQRDLVALDRTAIGTPRWLGTGARIPLAEPFREWPRLCRARRARCPGVQPAQRQEGLFQPQQAALGALRQHGPSRPCGKWCSPRRAHPGATLVSPLSRRCR